MKTFRTIAIFIITVTCIAQAYGIEGSVYTQRPVDPEAFYFTPENYGIKADGKTDVSEALQQAINSLKTEKAFGILFIPEGKYLISRTIHVPGAIRLIGYGKQRPEIILGKSTPGYQSEQNYMIWFTGGLPQPGREPQDAGAGTFYSALSNINLRIEKGNPQAVAIRSHFAQHGFISHCNLYIGEGKAGIYDVGNELEDVRFYGGDYGISSGRTSPGWPMMMVDVRFEGQRRAAVLSRETGFAIVNMRVRNVPVGFEMQEGTVDRLHLENSWFENISTAAVVVSTENSSFSQLNILNLYCRNVPTLVDYRQSGRKEQLKDAMYHVKDYSAGLSMSDLATPSRQAVTSDIIPLKSFSPTAADDLPQLPAMESWVNIRELGAKGDGTTDDTQVFKDAISQHKNIYVPQGWYRITETLKMREGTALIGLHPFGTQLILLESEPAFSGFGGPKPMVESSAGGNDVLNGIGISTGGYNYRAVGCKWLAGERSYMNDVKFVGGHGTMRKPNPNQPQGPRRQEGQPRISSPEAPLAAQGLDLAWDNQYWSLWVGRNGGGTIKDIWTASSFAASGLYVSHTSTPGRIYAMSLEHHVRNEARFESVSNWKIYAFQFEEEGREGKDCRMLELSNCSNLMFANLWIYRVIRASTPQEFGLRLWNCKDIEFRNFHNYTQVLPVIELPVYDVNKRLPVYDWDFARLRVTGLEPSLRPFDNSLGAINKLAEGFEFAAGITADSRGNIYFGENRLKKIYKWSAATQSLSLLADYPWKPFTMTTDTDDNLIVIFRYDPQPGYQINGRQESVVRLPDDNPMYSGWGNSGWAARAYSINPDDPDESFRPLPRVATGSVQAARVIHPASRWRGDFAKVVASMPDSSYLAPDGRTLIPETYDLGRSAALIAVRPGQQEPVYVVHENRKSTLRFDVSPGGALTNSRDAIPHGQYSTVTDRNGNLYIADGEIFVYDSRGNEVRRIRLEERPISLAVGGIGGNLLFATTSRSLFAIRIL
ncbi:MAG: glycoside hydrolase family 55 protein [Tannerellaceae bacterium]|jgi:hypothetical protein|nr:glycoside hydrolase family 55 protein [Tannerellaceae bacterium]